MRCIWVTLIFQLFFWYPIFGQLTAEEENQIQKAAIIVIKKYNILLRENANYFRNQRNGGTHPDRKKLINSAFEGTPKLFTSRAVRIVLVCNENTPKNDKNIYSSEDKIAYWLHLRPRTSTHQMSIRERDICVSKINSDKKKVHVLFKSKYEVPATNCQQNSLEPRIAIMSYLYNKNQRKWILTIDAIQFQIESSPCLTSPVITMKPSIAFERPSTQNTTVSNSLFDLKAKIQNVENKQAITLQVNGSMIKGFSFIGNSLSHRIRLLEGQNFIRISAFNGIEQQTKTIQIWRLSNEIDTTITITPEVAVPMAPIPPKITIRSPLNILIKDSRLNIVATISGVQAKDDIVLIVNGVVDKEFSYDRLHQVFEKTIDFSALFSSNQCKIEIEATNAMGEKDKKLLELVYEPHTPSNADQIRSLSEQITELKNTIRTLREEKNKLKQTLKKQQGNNNERELVMQKQINNLTSTIARLTANLTRKEGELRTITKELESKRRTITKLRQEKNDLQKENRILTHENKTLSKYSNNKTLYVGINYSLVKAPAGLVLADADILEEAFYKLTFRQLGIATYYHLGFFASNLTQISDPTPKVHYTMERVDEVRQELKSANIPFRDLQYLYSKAKLKAFTAGINIYTQIRPIYIKLGVSAIWGSVWDIHYGDYRGRLDQEGNGLYAIDFTNINTTDWLAGLVYVGPFFQIEAGYNWLYEDYFLNAGVNVPLVLKRKK